MNDRSQRRSAILKLSHTPALESFFRTESPVCAFASKRLDPSDHPFSEFAARSRRCMVYYSSWGADVFLRAQIHRRSAAVQGLRANTPRSSFSAQRKFSSLQVQDLLIVSSLFRAIGPASFHLANGSAFWMKTSRDLWPPILMAADVAVLCPIQLLNVL